MNALDHYQQSKTAKFGATTYIKNVTTTYIPYKSRRNPTAVLDVPGAEIVSQPNIVQEVVGENDFMSMLMAASRPQFKTDGWLNDAIAKVSELGKLELDWNDEDGIASTDRSIRAAKRVLQAMAAKSMSPDRIFADGDGGVQISCWQGDKKAFIFIDEDGEIALALKERSTKLETLGSVPSVAKAGAIVEKVKRFLSTK